MHISHSIADCPTFKSQDPPLIEQKVCSTDSHLQQAERVVAAIIPPDIPKRDRLVGDLGLIGDGITNDLPALQTAIDELSEAGGGRLIFDALTYFIDGPLVLKSQIELHLPEGSVLLFGSDPESYLPPVLARWEGTLAYAHSPLIRARNAHDIALTGRGTIDGNAVGNFSEWVSQQGDDQRSLREMGSAEVPINERVFGSGHCLRPPLIQFFCCSRVLVEGLRLHRSPFWMLHPVFSEHVVVRGVTFESHLPNNDGVDPDSSSFVLVEDCIFRTGDDAVAIKAGRDEEARSLGISSQNIVIRRNLLETVHNGVAIGSDMSGGVGNVFIYDNKIIVGRNLLYFKSNPDRGGIIENIRVWDIDVETALFSVIRFQTDYHGYQGGDHPPLFRDFLIQRIRARKSERFGILIEGHPSAPLQRVNLFDISIATAEFPIHVNPLDDVTMTSVWINGEPAGRIVLEQNVIESVFPPGAKF